MEKPERGQFLGTTMKKIIITACTILAMIIPDCAGTKKTEESQVKASDIANKKELQNHKRKTGMTQDRLNLTDEEYWTDIAKTERSIGDELREKRVSEIIVGVPQFVSLQDRKTIPMRLYKGGTFQDFRELDYDIHGLITAIDVDRNQISIAKTEIPEEFEEDEETEEEDLEGTSQKGYYVMSDDQDLMDRLFDDKIPGNYIITIIMRELVSNRVVCSIGYEQNKHTEELAHLLTHEKKKGLLPLQPSRGTSFLVPEKYEVTCSPTDPEQKGVELSIDESIQVTPDARALLSCNFRLPLSEYERVPEFTEKIPASYNPLKNEHGELPLAIKKIYLLITTENRGVGNVLEIDIPVFTPCEGNTDIAGTFEVDLFAASTVSKTPMKYYLYAFTGDILKGPVIYSCK